MEIYPGIRGCECGVQPCVGDTPDRWVKNGLKPGGPTLPIGVGELRNIRQNHEREVVFRFSPTHQVHPDWAISLPAPVDNNFRTRGDFLSWEHAVRFRSLV